MSQSCAPPPNADRTVAPPSSAPDGDLLSTGTVDRRESANAVLLTDILPELQPLDDQLRAHTSTDHQDDNEKRSNASTGDSPSSNPSRSANPYNQSDGHERRTVPVSGNLPPRQPSGPPSIPPPTRSFANRRPEHSMRPRSPLHRLISESKSSVPHFATRVATQLNYIENNRVSLLSDHTSTLKRIFQELLQLQLRLPDTGRFHLLFESQGKTVTTGTSRVTPVDLFSLFSPTVSTESHERRDNICTMGEVLVDFKHICDHDGISPSVPRRQDNQITPTLERDAHSRTNTEPSIITDTETTSPTASAQANTAFRDTTGGTSGSNNHNTTAPTAQTAPAADNEVHNDDVDIFDNWFLVPKSIMDKMVLPDWFPSPAKTMSDPFTENTLVVDIDNFTDLSVKEATFVYRTLFRSAHKKSLIPAEKARYDGNRNFKRCFSFIPFTPPWFVGNLQCRVKGDNVDSVPLTFDLANLPRIKEVSSTQILHKLQGLIAAFHSKEPAFAAACIDFLIEKCKCVGSHGPNRSGTQQHHGPETPPCLDTPPPQPLSRSPAKHDDPMPAHQRHNTQDLQPDPPAVSASPDNTNPSLPPEVTSDPVEEPLSPHSMMMKAFAERGQRPSGKRKRHQTEDRRGVPGTVSEHESDSDDSDDFMPQRRAVITKSSRSTRSKKSPKRKRPPQTKKTANTRPPRLGKQGQPSKKRLKSNSDGASPLPASQNDADADCVIVQEQNANDKTRSANCIGSSPAPCTAQTATQPSIIVAKPSVPLQIVTGIDAALPPDNESQHISLSSSASHPPPTATANKVPGCLSQEQEGTTLCSIQGCPGRISTYKHTCHKCHSFVHPLCEMTILKHHPECSDSHLCASCFYNTAPRITPPNSSALLSQQTTPPATTAALQWSDAQTGKQYIVPSQPTLAARQFGIDHLLHNLNDHGNDLDDSSAT